MSGVLKTTYSMKQPDQCVLQIYTSKCEFQTFQTPVYRQKAQTFYLP